MSIKMVIYRQQKFIKVYKKWEKKWNVYINQKNAWYNLLIVQKTIQIKKTKWDPIILIKLNLDFF